jgi:hypothetical protein
MGCSSSSAANASNPNSNKRDSFTLSVKSGQNTFKIPATKEETVAQIKHKIMEGHGIQPATQHLKYDGAELEDEKTLEQYEIRFDATLNLVIRLQA